MYVVLGLDIFQQAKKITKLAISGEKWKTDFIYLIKQSKWLLTFFREIIFLRLLRNDSL